MLNHFLRARSLKELDRLDAFDLLVKMVLLEHAALVLLVGDLTDEVGEQLVLDIGAVVAEELGVELLVLQGLALGPEEPQVELVLTRYLLNRLCIVKEQLGERVEEGFANFGDGLLRKFELVARLERISNFEWGWALHVLCRPQMAQEVVFAKLAVVLDFLI